MFVQGAGYRVLRTKLGLNFIAAQPPRRAG
jgi:hypothetical protein